MAITEVTVSNSALLKIGADRIVTMDDATKSALLCKEQLPKLRDEVLAAHPWHFAIKRAALSQTTAPVFEWSFAYQLPADYLAAVSVDSDDIVFGIEGQTLVTEENAINLKYIAQILDTSKWSPLFAEALAFRLAADLAYPIANSTVLSGAMLKAYDMSLKQAKVRNAQENSAQQLIANDWTRSRR